MNISFLDNWRKRNGADDFPAGRATGDGVRQEGIAELLAECELLRSQAGESGVELDDTEASLAALDQLLPRWRGDAEVTPELGNDAGLYLGTVIVRTVPGSHWTLWPNGHAVVELRSGREVDVVAMGLTWAETGAPELSQIYAEVSED